MSKIDFIIGLVLSSECMLKIIEVLLDNQMGYFCCTGVLQEQFMSPSVQTRAKRLWMQGFSGRDSFPSWGFKDNPMNLDRGNIGANCRHFLILDWNQGHSWSDCGNIHWDLLWHRDCLFRGWGRVRSWYE